MANPQDKVLSSPELIDMILNLLEPKDLKNARLVCQQWKTIGWDIIRLKSKVIIQREDKLRDYMEYFRKPGTLRPHSNYVFSSYQLQDKHKELIREFFMTFGPEILSLNLANAMFELDQVMQMTLKNLENFSFSSARMALPITSELVLQGRNPTLVVVFADQLDPPELKLFLPFLQQNSKVLKNLKFETVSKFRPHALRMILDCGFKLLDSLDFGNDLDDEAMGILSSGKIKTKKLDYRILRHHPKENLVTWLNSLSSNLENLHMMEAQLDIRLC